EPQARSASVMAATELAARLVRERARILVTEADEVSGPVIDLPLLAIGCARAYPVNVDIAAATSRGVPVLCAPGYDADAVAELTLALLLAVTRRVAAADRAVRAGRVPCEPHRTWEIAGRTFGMVGLGAAGRAVAWRMAGLGMRVIAHDPRVPEARHSLETVLAESDVISLHPSGPLRLGLKEFRQMKPGAVFINTAEPELCDLDALVGALRSGRLAGAGLDCLPQEWLIPGHRLTAVLADMDNVVLTPRIGGATYDTEVNHTRMICGDIVRILGGERPLHCANPEVLDAK
ncbi:MAG TPA: NAD(P)-dependent oxidoreductase, partial [Thermopolyspora sp.]